MTRDGHRRERASTVVDAARDPATPSKDGIARALHVVVGGGHSVGTRRAADAPRAADIETLSPRRLESARGARRDGRDARRGARVAGGRWLHARQRVSRETSAELSSFFSRCRSEVFPDAPISAVEPTENSRLLRWQGESSCSFRAFRKRAVVFALDFLFSCANTRTIERFVKRTKIPKLEPIRSRLPVFSRSHSTRVSLIPPNPSRGTTASPYTLVHSRRVFFGSRFREVGFTTPRAPRPAYPHAPHLRKSHPTSQWLPLPCLWPLSRPPSSARTSPPSRAPASPRSRPRRWLAAAPPSRYEHRRCARPHRARATDAARATIARARTPPDARLDRNARASPASSSRRPRARAAAPDRATSRKTRAIAPIQGPARVACGRGYAPDRPAREPRRPRDSVGARRDTRRARRGERRARRTPVPARATRRTSARGARSPRASTGSLSTRCRLERAVALGPGAPNPGFLSHEPARRKSEKTFRVFSNVAVVFFFVKTAPVPASNPAP